MPNKVHLGLRSELPKAIFALLEGEALDAGGLTWKRTSRDELTVYPEGEPGSPRAETLPRRRGDVTEWLDAHDQAQVDANDGEP